MRHSMSVSGPRDADDVWDRYLRPRRWPEWAPQIRHVDCPAEEIAPGAEGVVHGVGGLRVRFRILDVDPASAVRSWSWVVSPTGMRLRHTVTRAGAGARTGLETEGFAPVVLLYAPVARLALRRLVAR